MNLNALVGRRRRAEDCTPYRPQICHGTRLVGRVTPCAPRLQREWTKYPQRRLPNPFPIRVFPCSLVPTSEFGLNPKSEMGNEIERTCRAPSVVGRVTPCAPSWQSKMRSPNRPVSRKIRRCDEPERVGWQTAARRGLHALPTADLPWHKVGRARHSVRAAVCNRNGQNIPSVVFSIRCRSGHFPSFPVPASAFGFIRVHPWL